MTLKEMRRLEALRLVLDNYGSLMPGRITEIAEEFVKFLSGETAKAAASKTTRKK